VLRNSLSNGDSPSSNLLQSNETRLAYIPAVASGSGDSVRNTVEVPRSSVNTATGVSHMHSNYICFFPCFGIAGFNVQLDTVGHFGFDFIGQVS